MCVGLFLYVDECILGCYYVGLTIFPAVTAANLGGVNLGARALGSAPGLVRFRV